MFADDRSPSLGGRTVMLTRAPERSAGLLERLVGLGAAVVACPLVRSEADPGAVVPPLAGYSWLVVTSPEAVRHLHARLAADRAPVTLPAGLQVAVVGPGTARAVQALLGREPALQPALATGAELAAACRHLGFETGARVLRVRGDLAGDEVETALREAGAEVDAVTLYRTVPVVPTTEARGQVARGAVDAVVFASGSAVAGFAAGFAGSGLQERALAVCLGPITANDARAAGWRRVVVATEPSDAGLVAALVAALGADGLETGTQPGAGEVDTTDSGP